MGQRITHSIAKPRSTTAIISQQNHATRRREISLDMSLRYSVAGPSTTCMRTQTRSETYQELIYPLLLPHMRSGIPNYCWHGG